MSRTIDPFDEIAAMFLTRPGQPDIPPPQSQPHALTRPLQELLVVGHLPVRAGLWLVPYAEAVSSRVGATALVRLDSDEPSLQLLRPAYDAPLQTDRATLASVIDQLGPSTCAWLIRAASDAAPDDLLAASPQRITILTSGDQAATVSAYQTVKALAEAAQRLGRELPPIGLAVLGVDETRAREVHERVNHTAGECLNVHVSLAMCLPRISAGASAVRYLNFPETANPSLSELSKQVAHAASRFQPAAPKQSPRDAEPAPEAAAPEHVPAAPPRKRRPQLVIEEPTLEIETGEMLQPRAPTLRFPSEPLRIAPERSAATPPRQAATPRAARPHAPSAPIAPSPLRQPVLAEPKSPIGGVSPAVASHEPASTDGRPRPLATFINGLVTLPVRSPGHERIELAVDNHGVLHLLAREPELRTLRVVAQWVKSHAEILALACREHKINPAREAVCHVFTEEPAALADLHNAGLHLHVLAPVLVEGKLGWYTAPLNKL